MSEMPDDESTPLGREIIAGLQEFLDVLNSGEPIESRFRVDRIDPSTVPAPYGPADVKRTRDGLGVTQAVFARLLGVSTKAVSNWEQSSRPPSRMARRFMDEINASPAHWRGRVERFVQRKAKGIASKD